MATEIEFTKKEDYHKLGGILALSYGAYIPSLYILQQASNLSEFATRASIIAGIFLALRLPKVKQVPFTLGATFFKAVMAGKISEAPQEILDDVKELRNKAAIDHEIKVRIIEEGSRVPLIGKKMLRTAVTLGNEILIGKKLLNKLERKEMKAILAHEISHIKNNDISLGYLMWPPFISSALYALQSILNFAVVLPSASTQPIIASAITATLAYGHYKYQSALVNSFSRAMEYRADRNGVQLTDGDFKSAAMGILKIRPDHIGEVSLLKQVFKSHPQGLDRLRAIERSSTGKQTTECTDLAADMVRENKRQIIQRERKRNRGDRAHLVYEQAYSTVYAPKTESLKV